MSLPSAQETPQMLQSNIYGVVHKLNDSQDVYVYYLRSDNVSTTDIEDASKDIEWGW